MDLLEARKDLSIYKTLLNVLGKYTDEFPATGLDKNVETLIQHGKKIVTTNKAAQKAIESIFCTEESIPAKVQRFLNLRFAQLDLDVRPQYKKGNKKCIAFWCEGGKLYDKVKDLINWEGKKASGYWSDEDGKKVTLIDTSV